MPNPRSRKRDIDKARREKQAAKRERRAQSGEAADAAASTTAAVSESDVLESLRLLHERFDQGGMSFEDFEEAKADLLAKLQV